MTQNLVKNISDDDLKALFSAILSTIEITPVGVSLQCDEEQSAIFLQYIGNAADYSDSYLVTELLLSVNKRLFKPLPEARVRALVQDKITAALVGTTVMIVTENMEQAEKNTDVIVKNALLADDAAYTSGQTNYLAPL